MIIENILKLSKNLCGAKNFGRLLCAFWNSHNKLIFAIFSAVILLVGGYLWYGNIYRSGWNSEKKLQYKNAQNQEVIFKEKEFDEVIDEINRKQKAYGGISKPSKDIFKPYAEDKKETAPADTGITAP